MRRQAQRRDRAETALGRREEHPQRPGLVGQAQADVAVEEAEQVVVGEHDHRPPGIPASARAAVGGEAEHRAQARLQPGVQRTQPAPALAHRDQHPEALEGAHRGGDIDAGRAAESGAQQFEVGRVAGLDARERGRGGPRLGVLDPLRRHIQPGAQPGQRRLTAPGADVGGESADARIGAEAVALGQPDHAVRQHRTRSATARQGLRGSGPGRECRSGRAVRGQARRRRGTRGLVAQPQAGTHRRAEHALRRQLGEHRAGLDRGELVLVAEQHQAGGGRQGVDQAGGEREVEHRGLVDHQHVHRQRVVGVMTEAAGLGGDAEQAMHGVGLGGQAGGERRGQRLRALAQGLEHARGGLAGGRGERDAQARPRLQQAGEQGGDGGGLARPGPAADDGEPALQRQQHRAFLPVRRRHGARREQGVEQGRARCRGSRFVRHPLRPRHQCRRERALLVEMAAQVEAVARVHDQRMRRAPGRGLRRIDHDAAGEQPLAQACERCASARRPGIGESVLVPRGGRCVVGRRKVLLQRGRIRRGERRERHADMARTGRKRQATGDGREQREAVGRRAKGGRPVGEVAAEAVGEIVHATPSATGSSRPASRASSACRVAAGQR